MSRMSDKFEGGNGLLTRYQKGDEGALRQLIRAVQPKLEKTIYYTTRNRSVVKDISQECWYTIIPNLKKLEIKISFESYVMAIARRKSIDWIRTRQRQRKKSETARSELTVSSVDDQHESDSLPDKMKLVRVQIEQLPDSQKIVLKLFYLENLSLKEISDILAISEGTVKSRLFTARESIKKNVN